MAEKLSRTSVLISLVWVLRSPIVPGAFIGLAPGTITIYAEDGITPLGKGSVNLSRGKAYQLVVSAGG